MNQYVTGAIIKKYREQKRITQSELGEKIHVSDKAISKWENGKGYPDITIIEPLAKALGISVIELLSGNEIANNNRAFNMQKIKFFVCPICGNIICSSGEAAISCCGIVLPPLEPDSPDGEHCFDIIHVEDEFFISVNHEMSREHYISFIAAVQDNGVQIIKLYPEGNAEARVKINRTKFIFFFCNKHGLFKISAK